MADCCEDKSCEVTALKSSHAGILKAVLAINAVMFLVEGVTGFLAGSSALLGDSLDMLGDALAYGTSLYVLGKGPRWNALAAAIKGCLMGLLGILVSIEIIRNALEPSLPSASAMGAIGLLALMANLVCLGLLWKSRTDDLNMHSVWLCSRNDVIANIGVLAAALAVNLTRTMWPDLVVGVLIACLFLWSAQSVLARSFQSMRALNGRSKI